MARPWGDPGIARAIALELEPDYGVAHYNLGNLYAAENRYAEAVAAFNRALRIEPDFAPAHQSMAQVLALQGNKDAPLSGSGPARGGR